MKKFLKNYSFIICMLTGIAAGCIVGACFPMIKDGETVLQTDGNGDLHSAVGNHSELQ